MPRKLPPLLALEAFEAAARYENFAIAANELNLSQSAVSHRVRMLERYLGYPLFERLPRGLRLTEAAKAYLPPVRRAFEDILGATSGVFGQSEGAVLNIRAPISYTALWLTGIIDRFRQAYPHVTVHLTSTIWADKTAEGEADVEFRLGYGNWPGYRSDFLLRDQLVTVCSPETAEQIGQKTSAEELAGWPLLHVMGTQDYWGVFFEKQGVERPEIRDDIRVDSSVTAAELCATSNRISLMHQRFADHYVALGRLQRIGPQRIETDEALYMLHPESAQPQKAEAILFQRWVQSIL